MGQQTQIETLRSVLRESQEVKANLQRRLNEQRKKRKEKESELAEVNGKLVQTKDLFMKMKEAKDIAKHKTEKSQVQADSLELEIQKKREQLQKIDNDISELNKNRNLEVENFEEELSILSKQFKAAKQEYSDSVLTEKLKEAEFSYEETLKKAKEAEEEAASTASYLQSLQVPETQDGGCGLDKAMIGRLISEDTDRLTKELQLVLQEMEVTKSK